MPGPGTGRYTNFVPPNDDRRARMSRLFNERAANNAGLFYGAPDADPVAAAATVSELAAQLFTRGEGDRTMFPNGVDMTYSDAPDIASEVVFSRPGDPSNPYVPDLRSPGATGVDGVVNVDPKSRTEDPKLTINDIKPNMVIGVPQKFDRDSGTQGTGTVSPASTSSTLGRSAVGQDLVKGKSAIR